MINVLMVNGPNLNMLGTREPEKYGNITLPQLEKIILDKSRKLDINVKFFQSNSESEIINFIHANNNQAKYLVINAGAYTHTSIAIRDAILSVNYLTIEVHLTNIYKREDFRKISYISDIAIGVISGFGVESYLLALEYIYYREMKNEKN